MEWDEQEREQSIRTQAMLLKVKKVLSEMIEQVREGLAMKADEIKWAGPKRAIVLPPPPPASPMMEVRKRRGFCADMVFVLCLEVVPNTMAEHLLMRRINSIGRVISMAETV